VAERRTCNARVGGSNPSSGSKVIRENLSLAESSLWKRVAAGSNPASLTKTSERISPSGTAAGFHPAIVSSILTIRSIKVTVTSLIPDRLMVGLLTLNQAIFVRVEVGEPHCARSSAE
jgi:hypothetical protein